MIKIGEKYVPKKGHEKECATYNGLANSAYLVCGAKGDYDIYDKDGNRIGSCNCYEEDDIEAVDRNWDTLRGGDFIVSKEGSRLEVLEVLGDIFWTKDDDYDENGGIEQWTKKAAQCCNYEVENISSDKDVEEAIELLTKKGKLVDGKVIK